MQKAFLFLVMALIATATPQVDAQQTRPTQQIPTTTPAAKPQEADDLLDDPAPPPANPTQKPEAGAPTPKTNHIFVIFTDARPDQLIVLDDKGKWIANVREIKIEMTLGTQATATCTIWDGFFRPTNPTIQKWPLKQVNAVPMEEFQSMIDKLQKDANAVANK